MIHYVVDQASAAGFGAGEFQGPAVAGEFSSYRQALAQVKESAGAACCRCGGVGFGA